MMIQQHISCGILVIKAYRHYEILVISKYWPEELICRSSETTAVTPPESLRADMRMDMCADMRMDICADMRMDMCADMRMDMCADMHMDMCAVMCADLGVDTRIDMCTAMCIDTCIGACVDMYTDMCVDVCAGMCMPATKGHNSFWHGLYSYGLYSYGWRPRAITRFGMGYTVMAYIVMAGDHGP